MNAILEQEITSEATSLNHIPRLHKLVPVEGACVLDYGCGKYDTGARYLYEQGALVVASWDPFNRDPEANVQAAVWMYQHSADIILCSNVLNVLQEEKVRAEVIQECYDALTPGQGMAAYFTVYPGNRSGKGQRTTKGWQENRKLCTYLAEIRTWFDEVSMGNNIIKGVRK